MLKQEQVWRIRNGSSPRISALRNKYRFVKTDPAANTTQKTNESLTEQDDIPKTAQTR